MAFSVNCPECGTALEVEEDHREWTVRCPNCRHEFRPGEATFALVPMEDGAEPKPRRKKRRRAVDADDFDDEDDRADAASDVSSPATALKAVGWIGVVFSLLGLGIWSLLLAMAIAMPPGQKQANGQGRDEIFAQAALYIPQSILACGVSIVMIVGAGKMSRLESYGWAQTAAIIGMVPCISPCCLLGLPFGIWALSVLNKPHVQAAFKRNERGRGPSDEEDDG